MRYQLRNILLSMHVALVLPVLSAQDVLFDNLSVSDGLTTNEIHGIFRDGRILCPRIPTEKGLGGRTAASLTRPRRCPHALSE